MSDTIDRQAAIEIVDRYDKSHMILKGKPMLGAASIVIELEALPSAQPEYRLNEWCYDCKEYDQEHHCCPRYNRVIRDSLKDAQPEQRWIPCSERLPQPNEEAADGFIKAYLVQDGRWMDVARWNGDCWIAWGYGTALTNVIAWMPLPEPYKGEQE